MPALLSLAAAVLVQGTSPAPAVDTKEIVVTGRGLASSTGDAAYSVTLIPKKRIEESASARLEDVLRDVAGEQSFRRSDSRSSNATSQSITFRGMGGNASSRALLILDGVPQGDPFGGWISFPAFSTDRLASIRVTRGGGSALWGPGALSGTVELESAGPGELAPVAGSIAIGSRDSTDSRASLLVGDRGAFASLAGAFARGDGFIPIVAGDRGPIDRRAPYRQYSLAGRGVARLSDGLEIQANLSRFDDHRDRGLPNTANRGKGTDASLRLVRRGPSRWSLLAYAQEREFSNKSASVNGARTASILVNNQFAVPSSGWGGRAEFVPLSGTTEVRIGGDFRRVDGEDDELYQYAAGVPSRRREAGGRTLTAGLFADSTFERGPLVANLSGRIDRWTITHGRLVEQALAGPLLTDRRYPDRSGRIATGRAALSLAVSSPLSLRGAVYRGWRLPTLNELYRPFRVGADATAANAMLKPETSVGAEIGATYRLAPGWSASLTGFVSRLDDAIANVTIASGPGIFPGVGFVSAAGSYRRRENLDSIDSKGIEIDVAGRKGAFDAHLSYAFIDAVVRDSSAGVALDGLRPAQVPRHFASASLGWDGARSTRLALTARWLSRQYEDDLNRRSLDGALTVDGYARFALLPHLAVEARAENIFDREVDSAVSADGIVERALPRTLWFGLRLN